jgi:hypothetical protein
MPENVHVVAFPQIILMKINLIKIFTWAQNPSVHIITKMHPVLVGNLQVPGVS